MFSAYYHLTRKKTTEGKKEQNKFQSRLFCVWLELIHLYIAVVLTRLSANTLHAILQLLWRAQTVKCVPIPGVPYARARNTILSMCLCFFSSFLFFLKNYTESTRFSKIVVRFMCAFILMPSASMQSLHLTSTKKYAYVLTFKSSALFHDFSLLHSIIIQRM